MTQQPDGSVPMRIDLASSEIEGGDYISWVDPEQVIACVAAARPRSSFARYLEPRLADLDASLGAGTEGGSGLPPRVRTLLLRLRQAHARIFRENQLGAQEPRSVRLAVAVVEEGRTYFLKATRCWIFLLRDGSAQQVGPEPEAGVEGAETRGLGSTDRMSVAVTSVDVHPNDVVVLIAAETGEGVNHRAVTRVFEQSVDLKRACDGLVNLFGLCSSGAGAVAMRFVPVGQGGIPANGNSILRDIAQDLVVDSRDAFPIREAGARSNREAEAGSDRETEAKWLIDAPVEPSVSLPVRLGWEDGAKEIPLPAFLEEVEDPGMVTSAGRSRWTSDEAGPPESPREDDRVMICAASEGVGPTNAPEAPAGESCASVAEPDRAAKRFPRRKWTAAFAVAVVMMLGVLAIPGTKRFLAHRGSGGAGGVLRIEPTPPARAIFIDGVDQETGSPAILEGVSPGTHRVLLDLGVFGVIEETVRIKSDGTTDLRPRAVGSLSISCVQERPGGRVWLEGGEEGTPPCVFRSLPVGSIAVFYEDDTVPLWQREALVQNGEETSVRINNAFAMDRALLRVEAWLYQRGRGMRSAAGDSVFVDRRFVGLTPWEKDVAPGLHGVKVLGASGQTWTEVVDLEAGGNRIVDPRFGLEAWPTISHQEPGRVLVSGSILLTAVFTSPDGSAPRNPRLRLPGLDPLSRDLPLAPVDPERGAYVGMVDPRWVPMDRPVVYYFTTQTSEGSTLSSELYRFTPVSELSLATSP